MVYQRYEGLSLGLRHMMQNISIVAIVFALNILTLEIKKIFNFLSCTYLFPKALIIGHLLTYK